MSSFVYEAPQPTRLEKIIEEFERAVRALELLASSARSARLDDQEEPADLYAEIEHWAKLLLRQMQDLNFSITFARLVKDGTMTAEDWRRIAEQAQRIEAGAQGEGG